MTTEAASALVFALVTVGVIAFQVALALGAPLGAYAMGGANRGVLPTRLRVAAAAQALLLGVLALVVLGRANVVRVPPIDGAPSLVWLVVAFSAASLVLNTITRSSVERRIWAPVALVMLITSLVVAISPS